MNHLEYFPLKGLPSVWKENDQKQLSQVNFTYHEYRANFHKYTDFARQSRALILSTLRMDFPSTDVWGVVHMVHGFFCTFIYFVSY